MRRSDEPTEHLRARLTPEESRQLRDMGYFVCGKVLSDEELGEARSQVDWALVEYTNDETRPEKINFVHTYDSYFMKLATHWRLLNIVESVLGPDLALFSSHLLCKPARDGHAVAWHQDSAYWPLEPMEVLTLWLALDDADAEKRLHACHSWYPLRRLGHTSSRQPRQPAEEGGALRTRR